MTEFAGGAGGAVDVAAVDGQAVGDGVVVVDALIRRDITRSCCTILIDNGDEALADEEGLTVGGTGAIDDQVIDARVERAGVIDVDDVVGSGGGIDQIVVGAVATVEIDDVGDLRRRRGRRNGQEAVRHAGEDVDQIVSAAAVDIDLCRHRCRAELDVVVTAAGRDVERRGVVALPNRSSETLKLRKPGMVAPARKPALTLTAPAALNTGAS